MPTIALGLLTFCAQLGTVRVMVAGEDMQPYCNLAVAVVESAKAYGFEWPREQWTVIYQKERLNDDEGREMRGGTSCAQRRMYINIIWPRAIAHELHHATGCEQGLEHWLDEKNHEGKRWRCDFARRELDFSGYPITWTDACD
jgi:hypothetical protein